MPKISSFIIMILLFSLFLAGVVAPFLDFADTKYNLDDYNSTTLNAYDRIESIQQQTDQIKNKTITLQSRSGGIDVLGGFFEAGYDAIKLSFAAFGDFFLQINNLSKDSSIYNSRLIIGVLISIVLIIIVFLFIRIAVKDRV
jgi:hypothetical protein